jgi:hypothetical protein
LNMRARNKIVFTLIAMLFGVSLPLMAQESATIQATAQVATTLSITGTQNLRFGMVTPGVNKTVDKTTIGEAGEWQITGTPNAEISLSFALPDSLQHETHAFGMIVGLSATDASFDDGTGSQPFPAGVLNPNGPNAERLGVSGNMAVWIGGTVYPRVGQGGGNYASDIVLTVMYTGS